MKLNAKALSNLPAGRHGDGRGLYLMVQKRGTRSWTQVLRVAALMDTRKDPEEGALDPPTPRVGLAPAAASSRTISRQR